MSALSVKQEKRNKLITQAAEILQAEEITVEQRASAEKMLADVDVLETDITSLKRIEKFEAEQRSFEKSPRQKVGETNELPLEERKKQFTAAMKDYAMNGRHAASMESRDLLTIGAAGALIPQMFLPTLIEAQKFSGPIAQKVQQRVTDNNGAPMKIGYVNDTANGLQLVGEATPVVETDPSFSNKILGVDKVHSGLVKVSFEELEDSYFDLDTWLRNAFGKRYARGIEKAITTGVDTTGNNLPNTVSLLSVAQANTVTAVETTDAAGVAWNDVVNLFTVLDPAYVQNASYVMNGATRGYLIGLKDNYGRPFFENDPSTSTPFSKILGYDIVLDQAMPSMGASAYPIIFGDLSEGYMFRTDGQPRLLRLDERYADTGEVGFYLYSRIGGIGLNNALAALKMAAS